MAYTAADVANNGGVAWVRSMAAGMDPSGIDAQIKGYAAAQSVLQGAAASTLKGQATLSQSWNGTAARAAQQQFTTTANLHTSTAETIQQVMIGLSYSSAGMGSFIQTVLGPYHQVGSVPDPAQGIPVEQPVPLITDQQVSSLSSPPLSGSTSAFDPFQAHQNAVTQNLKVRQQAADALNELASSYSTAQTYFNGVSESVAMETGPPITTTPYSLGPAPTGSGKGLAGIHSPAVHSSGGGAAPAASVSVSGPGGLTLGGGGTTSLQSAPPISPFQPPAPVTGGNPPGVVGPIVGSTPGSGNPALGVFTGTPGSDGTVGEVSDSGSGEFDDAVGLGTRGRGLGIGGVDNPEETETTTPFEGTPGFGQSGANSAVSPETSDSTGLPVAETSPGGSSEQPAAMMGGMGQGMGRASGGESGNGESGRRGSRITRGQFLDSDEDDWQLPQPESAYEGATDQYGNPIEAYKTGWQRIREAAQKASNDRSELEGPW